MRAMYESSKLVIKIRSSLVIIKWEWGKPLAVAATPAEVTQGSITRSTRACYLFAFLSFHNRTFILGFIVCSF